MASNYMSNADCTGAQGAVETQLQTSDGTTSSVAAENTEPVVTEKTADNTEPVDETSKKDELLAELLDLGFDELASSIALRRTNYEGIEEAINWIVDRSNPSDLEDEEESDEDESGEEDEEMGAACSSAVADGVAMMRTLHKNARTYKMVLVANMGLKMGTGKLCAQVGHATLAVYKKAMADEAGKAGIDSWTQLGQVKIVVKGESTEQLMDLYKEAKDKGCFAYLVQDAGYTQIPPGSRTVLGVFGPKEDVDAVTGKLRLL